MRSVKLVSALFGAALCAGAGGASAADRGPLQERFNFSLGGFFVEQETDVRLDGEATGTGTDVDWEREFGLGDKDSFRIDAFWRFADRHKVRLMWFENNRSAGRAVTRDIEFGDTTYPVDTVVEARIDQQIIELAYEYSFMRRDTFELAGSIGIHNLKIEAGLSGEVTTPGGGGSFEAEETGEANGPLPVIGVRVFWDMGANFYLDGLAQFFAVEYEEFDGSLSDFKLGVTWYPFEHFGIGIGYNDFTSRLDVQGQAFEGKLRLGYGGPMAWITAGF